MLGNRFETIPGCKARRYIARRQSIICPKRLTRDFKVDQSGRTWVTDIMCHRGAIWQLMRTMSPPGLSSRHRRASVLIPICGENSDGRVIEHSNPDSRYDRDDWQSFCRSCGLEPDMSRGDGCWDYAVAESCVRSLHMERARKRVDQVRGLTRLDAFDNSEVLYNRPLIDSHLDGICPAALVQASNGGSRKPRTSSES